MRSHYWTVLSVIVITFVILIIGSGVITIFNQSSASVVIKPATLLVEPFSKRHESHSASFASIGGAFTWKLKFHGRPPEGSVTDDDCILLLFREMVGRLRADVLEQGAKIIGENDPSFSMGGHSAVWQLVFEKRSFFSSREGTLTMIVFKGGRLLDEDLLILMGTGCVNPQIPLGNPSPSPPEHPPSSTPPSP